MKKPADFSSAIKAYEKPKLREEATSPVGVSRKMWMENANPGSVTNSTLPWMPRIQRDGSRRDPLVKLNLTAGIDNEIYGEEYNRIAGEIEELRSKRAGVTQAEMMRQETLDRVQEIAKVLWEMDSFIFYIA